MLATMAEKKTTFGLTLSNRALVTKGTTARELIDMAVAAENTGFIDAIWVGDSILSKPRLECIPLLGAIAAHTSRVKLGVACMATIAQRNPVLLALQWASLDVLSGGRTWLAACMGYPASQHPMAAKELEVMGVQSKERPGRLEEMLQALRVLWTSWALRARLFYPWLSPPIAKRASSTTSARTSAAAAPFGSYTVTPCPPPHA